MKRIFLRLGIALATFFTGLLVAAVWLMPPNESVLIPLPAEPDCIPQYSETFSPEDYGGVVTRRGYIINLNSDSMTESDKNLLNEEIARIFNLFREMPLSKLPACVDESYRLTFFPTFHVPTVIRIWRAGGRYFIVKKHLSGRGGYDARELGLEETRPLKKEEWDSLAGPVNRTGFWQMPETIRELVPNDGATWTLEGFGPGRDHFVFRITPSDKLEGLFRNMFNLASGETDFEKYL
jgi:hypothetical protein